METQFCNGVSSRLAEYLHSTPNASANICDIVVGVTLFRHRTTKYVVKNGAGENGDRTPGAPSCTNYCQVQYYIFFRRCAVLVVVSFGFQCNQQRVQFFIRFVCFLHSLHIGYAHRNIACRLEFTCSVQILIFHFLFGVQNMYLGTGSTWSALATDATPTTTTPVPNWQCRNDNLLMIDRRTPAQIGIFNLKFSFAHFQGCYGGSLHAIAPTGRTCAAAGVASARIVVTQNNWRKQIRKRKKV